MGGDEFLLILPGCHEPVARPRAERLIESIKEHEVISAEQSARFSCSTGIAVKDSEEFSFEEIIKKADDNLYKAKKNNGGFI